MHKDLKYITRDFKVEVSCYYKDTLGGVYDIYLLNRCICQSVTKNDLNQLERILKLNK